MGATQKFGVNADCRLSCRSHRKWPTGPKAMAIHSSVHSHQFAWCRCAPQDCVLFSNPCAAIGCPSTLRPQDLNASAFAKLKASCIPLVASWTQNIYSVHNHAASEQQK